MAKNGVTTNNLFRDGSTASIQIGSTFQTSDNTGTPQISPLSYTTGVTTLIMPDNAAEVILAPSTDLRVSEISSMSQYYVIPAGQAEVIGVGKQQIVYVKADSSSGNLNFRITLI